MKTINKTNWRYKLIAAMFPNSRGWMPKNSCEFHLYTFVALLAWPIVLFNEFVAAIVYDKWQDVKDVLKNHVEDDEKGAFTWGKVLFHAMILALMSVVSAFFTIILMAVILYSIGIDTQRGHETMDNIGLVRIALCMIFVYALIGRIGKKTYEFCKKYCQPITYVEPEN